MIRDYSCPVRNLTETEYRALDAQEWQRRVMEVMAARLPPRDQDWIAAKKSHKPFDIASR